MEMGWNPDTVIAIATCVAAAAAIVAGIFAARSFVEMKKQASEAEQQTAHARRQAEQSEKQTEEARAQSKAVAEQLEWARVDRERAQAESVAAWTESVGNDLVVVVQNQSLTPIFDVRLATCLGTDNRPKRYYAARKTVLPPSKDDGHKLAPATATIMNLEDWRKKHPKNPLPRVDLIFKDKYGIEWQRHWDGQLHPYESEQPFPTEWLKADGTSLTATP
ncbi:hypothetical protein [Brevibacterium antiquum]|uniref:Uncharacterized protein n=1 Tax=Brevibacterium antiquum TaxID=234835 RepID=A0A2H1II56_9MICO|nr:hypothetical protein [Brevibacterium antiquum]SMX74863.1 hypothetical protein BANT10_00917 [Brevibacterium antiquum]